jgi:hypothetical protein
MDFLTDNSYYVVLGVVVLFWFAVFFMLTGIDKKLTMLEKE